MKAKWAGMVLLALGAGCGQGRAIFNVDVLSFLKPTGRDTVPYLVPPLTSATASTVQKISLPGVGSSIVDTVHAVGTATFINSGGSGTIQLQLYVATDSAGTYNASALAISLPASSVPGPDVTIDADLSSAVNSVFTSSQLWARVVAGGTNPGATTLQGKMVLKSLNLRIVVQDKLF